MAQAGCLTNPNRAPITGAIPERFTSPVEVVHPARQLAGAFDRPPWGDLAASIRTRVLLDGGRYSARCRLT
jgi:hypothetical protein